MRRRPRARVEDLARIHHLQRLFRLRAAIAQRPGLHRQPLRQPRLADGMSVAVSGEPEAVIRAVMAAAALVGILAVDPLGFSEVLASGWSERFVKLAREAEMLIRQ